MGEDRVKQRRREEGRGTERKVERQIIGGLRATVNMRAFPVGEMVLSRDGPSFTCVWDAQMTGFMACLFWGGFRGTM